MTLDELQRLTDDQLIEKVAVEAMGWHVANDPRCGACKDWVNRVGVWQAHERIGCDDPGDRWNPLTDWNHTIEVVERIESLGFEWRIDARPGLQRGCRIAPTGEFNTPRVQFVANDSGQRAICLAALLALSPTLL